MDGLGRVQEGARDAEAFQGGDELHADVGAFANAAHDELAVGLLRRDDGTDGGDQGALGGGVALVEARHEGQGGGLDRDDVHGARQRGRVGGRGRLVGRGWGRDWGEARVGGAAPLDAAGPSVGDGVWEEHDF
jgi:hypothetical protein